MNSNISTFLSFFYKWRSWTLKERAICEFKKELIFNRTYFKRINIYCHQHINNLNIVNSLNKTVKFFSAAIQQFQ
jgi:hypothetical protein